MKVFVSGKLVFGGTLAVALMLGCADLPAVEPGADVPATPPVAGQQLVPPPGCGREHVYVFVVNGCTILPHLCGSLNLFSDALCQHGFVNSETATHYYRFAFLDRIRCIHRNDPHARFVLIGYSMGASVVHSMAMTLERECIPVALMVYLDGHTFVNNFHERPANAKRVVCVTSSAYVLRGHDVPEADCVVQIGDSRHLNVPRKDRTMQFLLCELEAVAAAPIEALGEPAPHR